MPQCGRKGGDKNSARENEHLRIRIREESRAVIWIEEEWLDMCFKEHLSCDGECVKGSHQRTVGTLAHKSSPQAPPPSEQPGRAFLSWMGVGHLVGGSLLEGRGWEVYWTS